MSSATARIGVPQRAAGRYGARQRASTVLRGLAGQWDLEAETYAWMARLPASPTIERRNVLAVNNLIKELKADGLWDRLQRLMLPGDTLEQTLVDIRSPVTATAFNAPSFVADKGWIGDANATNKPYIATGLVLGAGSRASSSLFGWSHESVAGNFEIAAITGSYRLALRWIFGGSSWVWHHADTFTTFPTPTTAEGFLGVSRDGDTLTLTRGGQNKTVSQPSNGAVTGEVMLNRLGTGATYSSSFLGCFGYAEPGYTPAEMLLLYEDIVAYFVEMGVIVGDELPPPEDLGANCFTPATIASVTPSSLRVIQQAGVPLSNAVTESTYNRFPITHGFVQAIGGSRTSTWTPPRNGGMLFLQWAAKWSDYEDPGRLFNERAKFLSPAVTNTAKLECRQEYVTTYLMNGQVEQYGKTWARAADNIVAMWMMGYSDAAIIAYGAQYGYNIIAGFETGDVLTWAVGSARKDDPTLFGFPPTVSQPWICSRNKIILPQYRFADFSSSLIPAGIRIDYELQNGVKSGRVPGPQDYTEDDVVPRLQEWAAIIKNAPVAHRETGIYTNPLNSAVQRYTYFNERTLPILIADPNIDSITVVARAPIARGFGVGMAQFLDQQLALFGDALDYSKISWVLEMGAIKQRNTVEDAAVLRDYIVNRGGHSLDIWPNLGIPGGVLSRDYNQVLATALGLPTS